MTVLETDWDTERICVIDKLCNRLFRHLEFSKDVDTDSFFSVETLKSDLLAKESGSIYISSGCSSPKIANGIQWNGSVSLHWIWQKHAFDNSFSCCLNFLAQQGTPPTSAREERCYFLENIQWTLEASTSELNSLKTFWKIGSVQASCVEFLNCTLMGFLDEEHPYLLPEAVLFCPTVSFHSEIPKTAAENIALASLMVYLDQVRVPELQWDTPPVPHLGSTVMNTLGDVFRHVYNFLEDDEIASKKEGKEMRRKEKIGGAGNKSNRQLSSFERSSQEKDPSSSSTSADSPPSRFNLRQSFGDSLAVTAGCVATGASYVTPIGAAVSVAALGVKDGVAAAAKKGRASRDSEVYQFGDVTRGVMESFKTQRQQQQLEKCPANDTNDDEHLCEKGRISTSSNSARGFLQTNGSRYAGVVGSCAGAAVGLTLAGPLGLMAGSLVGSQATQAAMRNQSSPPLGDNSDDLVFEQFDREVTNTPNEEILRQMEDEESAAATRTKPYRFGDFTRGVLARGKQASGRDEDSPYRFGDFSRGLFARK